MLLTKVINISNFVKHSLNSSIRRTDNVGLKILSQCISEQGC